MEYLSSDKIICCHWQDHKRKRPMSPSRRPYHHADLRAALLAAAVATIEDNGAAGMSVREVARRAGVTHTAATYHFGDRAGLLAAVAAEGYALLAGALVAASQEQRGFLEMGVAYVRFAIAHRAHFEVMYQPRLYDPDDRAVQAAKQETAALLYGSRNATNEQLAAGVAAWAIVHGFVTLWLNDNIPSRLGDDPEDIARAVASNLRVPRGRRA
jgi:AcrR family transcriptional regulator